MPGKGASSGHARHIDDSPLRRDQVRRSRPQRTCSRWTRPPGCPLRSPECRGVGALDRCLDDARRLTADGQVRGKAQRAARKPVELAPVTIATRRLIRFHLTGVYLFALAKRPCSIVHAAQKESQRMATLAVPTKEHRSVQTATRLLINKEWVATECDIETLS